MVVPPKHPKMIILVGKPMIVVYHHFGKPPYTIKGIRELSRICRRLRWEAFSSFQGLLGSSVDQLIAQMAGAMGEKS